MSEPRSREEAMSAFLDFVDPVRMGSVMSDLGVTTEEILRVLMEHIRSDNPKVSLTAITLLERYHQRRIDLAGIAVKLKESHHEALGEGGVRTQTVVTRLIRKDASHGAQRIGGPPTGIRQLPPATELPRDFIKREVEAARATDQPDVGGGP